MGINVLKFMLSYSQKHILNICPELFAHILKSDDC